MKILFLDIDGVLNSASVLHQKGRGDAICEKMVARVNQIIEATGCKIVISSTWRLLHKIDQLKQILITYGLLDVIIDYTPHFEYQRIRGDEIQAWLDKNPVNKFVILDDNSDMGDDLINRLVQTTWQNGLEDSHVKRVINILKD